MTKRHLIVSVSAFLLLLVPGMPSSQTPAQVADAAAPAPASTKTVDEFAIPNDATPEALVLQARNLMKTQKEFQTQEEYSAWVSKMLDTVLTIVNKVLAMPSKDEVHLEAVFLKGQVLYFQSMLNPAGLEALQKFVDESKKDAIIQKTDEGKRIVLAFQGAYYQGKAIGIAQNKGDADSMKALMADVWKLVSENPEISDMILEFIDPITVVAEDQGNPQLVNEIFDPIYEGLKKSEDSVQVQIADVLQGILRFAQLPGNKMELEGILTDGTKFDPNTLKEKVVVIDFWATWCGPCRMLYPKLETLYKQYHDQGLEVIGYSVDKDTAALQEYVKEENVPWPVISQKDSGDQQMKQLANYYGIQAIPTLILIGEDGKVISCDINIDDLAKTLDTMFKAKAK